MESKNKRKIEEQPIFNHKRDVEGACSSQSHLICYHSYSEWVVGTHFLSETEIQRFMEDGKSRNWISIWHLFTNDVGEAEKQNRMKHELDELCVQKIEISVFQIQGRHVGWGEEGSEVAKQ